MRQAYDYWQDQPDYYSRLTSSPKAEASNSRFITRTSFIEFRELNNSSTSNPKQWNSIWIGESQGDKVSVRVNCFTTYASTMQTYFIQAKKFNLVESSICTQSIINTNSLKFLIFPAEQDSRYNSYTFRIGVSVLHLIYMSFDEKLNKFRRLILSKSSLQILQITNLLFHIVPLDRSVTFIDLFWTSSFAELNSLIFWFDLHILFFVSYRLTNWEFAVEWSQVCLLSISGSDARPSQYASSFTGSGQG